MRILADENFPLEAVDGLIKDGHDVAWARTQWPGARDIQLLDQAEAEGRVLLTLDRDLFNWLCRDVNCELVGSSEIDPAKAPGAWELTGDITASIFDLGMVGRARKYIAGGDPIGWPPARRD